jgi:hypothetical protein
LIISRPRSGAGQDGMIRKGCGNIIPPAEQGSGRALYGQKGEPSIPITETDEGTVKPEWARVTRIPESRHCQSSASPRKSGIWIAGGADSP